MRTNQIDDRGNKVDMARGVRIAERTFRCNASKDDGRSMEIVWRPKMGD